ncbi:hypothetical protein DY000_02045805 [Brassica cretica]|uniref:DUF1985 domain-containing protein n=1 Tax=Brassica cretica TaxID=69181 RepID=A0ABQ7EQ48_BRACR|nr:hypothetical protein DY000_02045805 [Brassica cretica]
MSIQTNVDLGFPLRLFSVGCEPKPKKSINHHSKTEFLEDVENDVGEEVWDIVRASPLRVIIRFVENKFTWSSKIVEHLLVNQLACKKKQEMWCLFGNTPARFSLSEFENITALNCTPFVEDEDVTETKSLPLRESYHYALNLLLVRRGGGRELEDRYNVVVWGCCKPKTGQWRVKTKLHGRSRRSYQPGTGRAEKE